MTPNVVVLRKKVKGVPVDIKIKTENVVMKDGTLLSKFLAKLLAKQGTTGGQDGVDGITPHIGENGNWFIGEVDTGQPSRGLPGADGLLTAPTLQQVLEAGNNAVRQIHLGGTNNISTLNWQDITFSRFEAPSDNPQMLPFARLNRDRLQIGLLNANPNGFNFGSGWSMLAVNNMSIDLSHGFIDRGQPALTANPDRNINETQAETMRNHLGLGNVLLSNGATEDFVKTTVNNVLGDIVSQMEEI